jgi:O-antigen/teichoic acid export membrane protein
VSERIARKSLENFLARIAAQAFAIAGAIVVARVLGPSGKGAFSYAGTVLAMLQMANAGQAAAISWQYAKQGRSPGELLRAMLRILALFGIPAVAVLVIAGLWIPSQGALLAVAAALPFALFAQSSTGFFLADADVRMINVQQLLIGVLSVAVYIPLLILVHAGLTVLLGIWAFGYVAGALYSALRLRRYAQGNRTSPQRAIVREQLTYGGQVSMNSAVQYLNFRIDVFIVMFMLGQTALGVYSIGIGIGEMLWQLSRPIVTASFGAIARGTERQAANTTAACMRHSFALVLIAAVVTFFAAPPLVPLIYGQQFAHAGAVTRLLLPGIVAYSMMPILGTFFAQQLGQPRIPLIFNTASTVVCALLTVALLPKMGIAGGALATSVSYCAAFAAAVTYFVHRTQIGPRRIFTLSRTDLEPYRTLFSRASVSARESGSA